MWESLPADALATVFALLPRNDKSLGSCRLVCRSWKDVADASPRIWSRVSITAQTAAASAAGLSALLQRQRPFLGHIQLDSSPLLEGSEEESSQALAMVLAAACGPDSRLASFTCKGTLAGCFLDALPGSASHLTALALRELRARGRGASALSWGQLSHMPQLLSLSLDINFSEAGQPSLALETLTRLTRLRLQAARCSRAPPRLVRSVLLAAPLSLRQLELQAIDVLLVLPSCRALTSLHFAPDDCSPQCVEFIARCSSLQDLVLGRYNDYRLRGLPSGALPHLTRLKISSSSELMKLHPSWCCLPKLLCFEVESCEQLLHLPLEMSTLTQLQRLSLSHQHLEEGFPWHLTSLSQLTYIAVAASSLEHLPEGPYLRNLRHLNCFANNLTSVPPALFAHPELGAPALRRLDLSCNYNHQLSAADVAVCSRLTALTFLDLSRRSEHAEAHGARLVDELRAALPHCTILA
ncbi:Leucine-rich repeat receptor-like serine/threonine-protein kinase BAM3 [Chlorella vulgaris]